VRVRAHRGAVAATISEDRIEELFEALAEMEGVCARLAAAALSAGARRDLEALHARCGDLVRSGDAALYHAANAEFHAAIRDGCGNRVVEEMTADLRRRFAPLSLAQFRGPGRLAQSYAEHHVIIAAILRGDGERAYQATRAHLLSVRRSFISYAESAGRPAAPAAE
jgi:DNA-binding GntR family transcriptional regulator